jgi:hypothetical protein
LVPCIKGWPENLIPVQDKADLTGLVASATGEAPLGLESTGNTAMNRLWALLHGPCVTVQQRRFGV